MAVIKRTHVLGCAASAALAALLTLVCLAILDGGSRANKWISLTDYMYDDLFPGETQALSPEVCARPPRRMRRTAAVRPRPLALRPEWRVAVDGPTLRCRPSSRA